MLRVSCGISLSDNKKFMCWSVSYVASVCLIIRSSCVKSVIYVASVCLIMRSSCVTSVISLSDNKEFMCYECHI